MDKDQMRSIVRSTPEYQEGQLSDAQVEQIVEAVYSRQDEILEFRLQVTATGVAQDPEAGWLLKRGSRPANKEV